MFLLAGKCAATRVRKTSITSSSYHSFLLHSDLNFMALLIQARYGINIFAGVDQAPVSKKIDEFLYSRGW